MGASVRPQPVKKIVDEKTLPPADLWDKKVADGLSPDSATAYVARLHGPPPLPTPKIQGDASATNHRTAPSAETPQEGAAGLARSLEQGATFGFGDELNAAVRSLGHETFDEALADERGSLHKFRENHPVGSVGAELVGGVGAGGLTGKALRMLGLAKEAASTATTLSEKALNLVKTTAGGAAAGSVAGAGSAEGGLDERARGAARGAAFGAGTVVGIKGAGAIAEKTGISPAVRALAAKLKPSEETRIVGPIASRAGLTVEDAAREDILAQIRRAGLNLQDVQTAAADASPHAMLLDVGGQPMLRRAEGAAQMPSRGAAQIETKLRDRVASQPARVQAITEEAVTGKPRENAVTSARQLVDQRRAAAKPLYEKAYQGGEVDDPEVLATLKLPHFKEAHARARRIAQLEGVDIPELERQAKFDGEFVVQNGKPIMEQVPQSIRSIDYIKRGLDDYVDSGMRGGSIGKTEAFQAKQRLNAMLNRVDELHPDYKAARDQFAGDSRLLEAHERGQGFLKEPHDELAADWPTLSDGERELYRRGVLSSLSADLAKVTDGRDVTRMFQNPMMRDKLRLILPDQAAANKFMKQLADETAMHKNAQAVLSGSPTARRLAQMGDDPVDVGGVADALHGAATGNPVRVVKGLLGSSAKKALKESTGGLTEKRVDALAPYLTASGSDLSKALQEVETTAQKRARMARAGQQVRQATRIGVTSTVAKRRD
jgi:hypothetical protein